ncbi:hypothetical protein [Nonlabens sp. YIK11]|nr:hypothetical protein [Nonlabens sp. YIK11]
MQGLFCWSRFRESEPITIIFPIFEGSRQRISNRLPNAKIP